MSEADAAEAEADQADATPFVNAAGLDPNDPDSIASKPPTKAIEPKQYFQQGQHLDKWSEYDERGVPIKNNKKKKPTKKEKDQLESDYLDQSKAYQKYLKDVENWEQAKVDAEKDLKKSDRLRWSFRQVGEKHAPIEFDDMETVIKLMGWKAVAGQEMKVIRKGLGLIATDDKIELEPLRVYVKEVMPVDLMMDKLLSDQLDQIDLEDLYSPRTWRTKLEADPPPASSKKPGKAAGPPGSARGAPKKKPGAKKADDGGEGEAKEKSPEKPKGKVKAKAKTKKPKSGDD